MKNGGGGKFVTKRIQIELESTRRLQTSAKKAYITLRRRRKKTKKKQKHYMWYIERVLVNIKWQSNGATDGNAHQC